MPRRGVIRMLVLQSTVWILPAHIERCMAQETAPSLGDVARKERELKKNSTTSSGKKWTDEDISAAVAPVYYPEVRASFAVPRDWTLLKRSAGTSDTSGHVSYSCASAGDSVAGVLQFSLGGYASPGPGSETAALEEIEQRARWFPNTQIFNLRKTTVAGHSALEAEFSYNSEPSKRMNSMQVLLGEQHALLVVVMTAASQVVQQLSKDFDLVVDSLQPGTQNTPKAP